MQIQQEVRATDSPLIVPSAPLQRHGREVFASLYSFGRDYGVNVEALTEEGLQRLFDLWNNRGPWDRKPSSEDIEFLRAQTVPDEPEATTGAGEALEADATTGPAEPALDAKDYLLPPMEEVEEEPAPAVEPSARYRERF